MTIMSHNRIQQHAQIAILNRQGIDKSMIAWFGSTDRTTVNRWCQQLETTTECRDQYRSGQPRRITEAMEIKTIAVYCQTNPLPGVGRFSLRDAAQYLNQQPEILGDTISYSSIRRILKSHGLRPHLNKYFLNITDPDFFRKMKPLLNILLNPPPYLFSYDECPGIQALMSLGPDSPAGENTPAYQDFQYRRQGTVALLAVLEIKTGQIFGRCYDNHRRDTLISLFQEHVQQQPAGVQLHYVMDNFNTHFHHDFCQVVAQLSQVTYFPLESGAARREWLQRDDKRIVIHFTPFHGSWLNLIEIWFGMLHQKCLQPRRFTSVEMLISEILNFIVTWNKHYAHPFTWKYNGDGLYEKTVSRFTKWLLLESVQMDLNFLNNQFQLLANIAQDYPQIRRTQQWRQLKELLPSKNDFLQKRILETPKEQKQKMAWSNLENLTKIMNCQS
jgi:hypothetical protein